MLIAIVGAQIAAFVTCVVAVALISPIAGMGRLAPVGRRHTGDRRAGDRAVEVDARRSAISCRAVSCAVSRLVAGRNRRYLGWAAERASLLQVRCPACLLGIRRG